MLVHPGLLTMKVSNTLPSDFNELPFDHQNAGRVNWKETYAVNHIEGCQIQDNQWNLDNRTQEALP